MKDATLDLQLLVPALKADAKVSAHIHREEGLTLELKTDIKLPETNSVQEITLKYGEYHYLFFFFFKHEIPFPPWHYVTN